MPKTERVFKIPKTLAACADRAYLLRQQRLAEQKDVDVIEQEEKALKAHLIDHLPKSEASGVSGQVANAKIETDEVPSAKDWELIYRWIKKQPGTSGFAILGRSLSREAVRERWAAKKVIPGVEPFQVVTVSLTKI